MYQDFFGLKNTPFSIVPDHRVVYMSESHREAVAHLLYSLKKSGGFIQLTGEVGTGKTTVSRYLLQHLPKNVDVALLLNPRINEQEMLETICDELNIRYPRGSGATLKNLINILNYYLLASHSKGRHTVLIIDEAQNLSREVLEQVRLLTNLETNTDKLLQIILIGQPELVHMLNRHDLRQLSQRIVGRYKLKPLNLKETREYITYRLEQAGCDLPLFTRSATQRIHKLSQGIPRVINVLCDNALMGAYSEDLNQVSVRIVNRAASEVLPERPKRSLLGRTFRVAMVPLLIFTLVVAYWSYGGNPDFSTLVSGIWELPQQKTIDDKPVRASRLNYSEAPGIGITRSVDSFSTAMIASTELTKSDFPRADVIFHRDSALKQN
jgi:general secretion pathway protein A